jgi:hypothetical protein
MMTRKTLILAVAVLLLASACVSKPPAKPEPAAPAPVTVEPAATDTGKQELIALHERVLALRKQAFDLGARELAADDYQAADALYIEGKTAFDADSRDAAKAAFEKAEPLFVALIQKATRLGAEKSQSGADAARVHAEGSGASELSTDAMELAAQAYAEGVAAMQAGDHAKADAAFAKATLMYDAAEKRSRAVKVKARIDEMGYAASDATNYQLANDKLAKADAELAGNPAAAVEAVEEALLRYNLVLSKGWELSAGGKKAKAEEFKLKSDEIKAEVAVKDDYIQAQLVWDSAVEAFAKGDFEYAAELFAKAETLFTDVYRKAAAKRAAAESAMQAAAAKRAESADAIKQADAALSAGTKAGE